MKQMIYFALAIMLLAACSKSDQKLEEFSEVTLNQEEEDVLVDTMGITADIPEPPEEEVIVKKQPKPAPIYHGPKEYEVQLLSLTDHGRSLALQKSLQDRGYETKITETYKDGQLFYRLRLKQKFTKDEATAMGEEVKSKFSAITSYWVQKVK